MITVYIADPFFLQIFTLLPGTSIRRICWKPTIEQLDQQHQQIGSPCRHSRRHEVPMNIFLDGQQLTASDLTTQIAQPLRLISSLATSGQRPITGWPEERNNGIWPPHSEQSVERCQHLLSLCHLQFYRTIQNTHSVACTIWIYKLMKRPAFPTGHCWTAASNYG